MLSVAYRVEVTMRFKSVLDSVNILLQALKLFKSRLHIIAHSSFRAEVAQ
jgi:hypothetical protein